MERKGEERRKKRESRPEEKTPFSDSTPDQIKIGLRTLYYLGEEERERGEKLREGEKEKIEERGSKFERRKDEKLRK